MAKPAAATKASLTTTSQYLVFEPGLYSVDVIAERTAPTDMGVALPCIRVEPVPPTRACPGRLALVDPGNTGWLWRRAEPALVVVVGGRAGTILTVYRADDGMAAPEIRIRHINTTVGSPATGASGVPEGGDTVPVVAMAHITQVGDVQAPEGGWIGRPRSRSAIEGFSLAPAAPLAAKDIEYQAVLGNNWNTPWFGGGEFCGSRGMMLPLLGICVRLKGPAAEAYECSYTGRFVDGKTSAECRDGAPCQSGDVALEAFQVVLRRRGAAAAPAAKPDPRPAAKAAAPRKAAPKDPKPQSGESPSGETQSGETKPAAPKRRPRAKPAPAA